MLELISLQTAAGLSISLLCLFVIFHLFVIVGVVPSTVVWGGRLTGRRQLIGAELFSISLLFLSAAIIHLKAGCAAGGDCGGAIDGAAWAVVAVFSLNTVGNIFAKTAFERITFAPVTLIIALLALRIAL